MCDTRAHCDATAVCTSSVSCVHVQCCVLQGGQIVDIRSMINEATRLNVEEGSTGNHGPVRAATSC